MNRHPSKHLVCTVKMKDTTLDGTYKATILTGDSPDAYNDHRASGPRDAAEVELTFRKGVANLPPHSLTIVEIPLTE